MGVQEEEEEENTVESTVLQEDIDDAEVSERLEAELAILNAIEAGDENIAIAKENHKAQKKSADRNRCGVLAVTPTPLQDPDTVEEWIALQDAIFGSLPPLPKGWIRIRSKSRGLVYFYNTKTGESTPEMPKR